MAIRLTESVGGTSVTITDQGACAGSCVGWTADINATLGVVTGSGSLGGWTVNVTTGMGFPFISGGNVQGALDLNSVNATSAAGGGTLTVQLSQTGFDIPFPGFRLSAGGTLAGSGAGASVTFTASGGNNNTAFSTSNTIATLGPFVGAAFSGNATGSGNSVLPYALTLTTSITASATGVTTYSGDEHMDALPEPTTLVLVGGGLAAFVRRAKRTAR